MGLFSRDKDESKKDEPPKAESQRVASKVEAKTTTKKVAALKTFVVGFTPNEKLASLPADRYEEGL